MKQFLSLVFVLSYFIATAQIVNIPDSIFKDYLLNEPTINVNSDSEIQLSEAENVSTLALLSLGIDSLTGIEAFSNLVELNCSYNSISSLDLSNNLLLEILFCRGNSINELNINNNALLTHLYCDLKKVDSLSLANSLNLERLALRGDSLEYLNIENNSSLANVELFKTKIEFLDFTNNPNLDFLLIEGSSYLDINLLNNQNLESLRIFNTKIDSINLDSCTSLSVTFIRNNSLLTYLSIKNGQNYSMSSFTSYRNNNLYCIGIDNQIYPSMSKDLWTEFNNNCPTDNCKSHSLFEFTFFCLYGQDSIDLSSYQIRIDTLINDAGCDSLMIGTYRQPYDSYYVYDSIFLSDTLDYLKPKLSYRSSFMGSPLVGPYITEFYNYAYEFQWYENDLLIDGAIDSIYTPTTSGYYKVELTAKGTGDLCKVFSLPFFVSVPTSIDELENNIINIFPNPFDDLIWIKTEIEKDFDIIIYDILGKELLKTTSSNNQELDLKDFDSGVYFLHLLEKDSKKVIQQIKLIRN